MPARNGGTNWSILIAGAAMGLTFISGIWSLVNPKGDTEKLEKRLAIIEDTLAWKYVSKELAAKDIDYMKAGVAELKNGKVDKDVYDQKVVSLERQLGIQRERLRDLDHSVNQTFNARDALTALQGRILELERAARAGGK